MRISIRSRSRTLATCMAACFGWIFPGTGGAAVMIPAAPTGLPVAPSGFSTPYAAAMPSAGVGDTLLGGFGISTSLSGTYDSNVTQSPGSSVDPVENDFILSLGGGVNYMSKSTGWTFGGNYRGSYNEYFNLSDFSGYSQGGGLVANYEGGRVSLGLNAGVDYDQGSNRDYASAFVKRTNYTTGITGRYRFSPKTSLQGNFNQSFSTASGGSFDDTQSYDLGASALWRYSKLTEIGPGIRYTYRSGSSQTGRSSVGPTLSANYKLSTKVALNSRVGIDFASYEDGGSADPTFSTSIGLNYEASRLWGMNFTLYRDTQADTSIAGGFTEVTSFRVGYHRKVRRATLNLGLGYDANRTEIPGAAGGNDRDYFTLDGSMGMAVFSNTSFASIFVRYAEQSGSATASWDSVQTGISISRSF